MKVTVIMGQPDPKKHSTKFSTLEVDQAATQLDDQHASVLDHFKPQLYFPAPFLHSRKLRVTVETIE